MSLTLVELKAKLKDQLKELIGIDDFKITFAHQDVNSKKWNVTVSYVTESQPDSEGRKFRLERNVTLTTDAEGKVYNIQAF